MAAPVLMRPVEPRKESTAEVLTKLSSVSFISLVGSFRSSTLEGVDSGAKLATGNHRGPKDHINIRISHTGPKAKYEGIPQILFCRIPHELLWF